MALTKIDDRGLTTPIDLLDNEKIRFGTGNDLEVYFDGTHSKIVHTPGSGNAYLATDSLILSNAAMSEYYLTGTANGAVELYYDNSKKLHTVSGGIYVTGNVYANNTGTTAAFSCTDNGRSAWGSSNDLQIYHDGTNSTIYNSTGLLNIQNDGDDINFYAADDFNVFAQGTEAAIKAIGNGAVELYYDSGKKFETNDEGINVTSTADAVLQVTTTGTAGFHDSRIELITQESTFQIQNDRSLGTDGALTISDGTDTYLQATKDAEIGLYYDNSKKFETWSSGARLPSDNNVLAIGAGDDLRFWHNATNSIIRNATGQLQIQSNDLRLYNYNASETYLKALENGAVELYYDSGKKFETTSGGAKVHGFLNLTAGLHVPDGSSSGDSSIVIGAGNDMRLFHSSANSHIYHNGTGNLYIESVDANITLRAGDGGTSTHDSIVCTNDAGVELLYNGGSRFVTTTNGAWAKGHFDVSGDLPNGWIADFQNDGNDANRYGLQLRCGADDGSGTNYAVAILTGNGTTQGYITFSGGTVTYGAFTAHHPCIVPDSENPSDSSNAYPYGTLLETISIEYTKQDGADTERGIRYKVQKTQSANSRKVLGAYGSSMNGGPDGQTNEHQALVLGDGHILVNNAGGNIEVGDGICSSATAGIGQKATANPSMIIGIAQEAITFTGSETKLVAVQYGLQQFIPWT